MAAEDHPKKGPLSFGTCPKCYTSYELAGTAPPAGVLCPYCSAKGYLLVGVIHFKLKKPTLREAAEALLKYIEEDNVRSLSADKGDGDDEFEVLVNAVKEALKQ